MHEVYDPQQLTLWKKVLNKLGYKAYPDDAEDIAKIKWFLDQYLGAQDAFLISGFIGTGVAYNAFSVLDKRAAIEEIGYKNMNEFKEQDKIRGYGSTSDYAKTVDDAYDNAKEVLLPEIYEKLVLWGEAKVKKEEKSLEDNADQDADEMWGKVVTAITPSPSTSLGLAVVVGIAAGVYVLLRNWKNNK